MYYLNTYCKVHFVRIPVGKESRKICFEIVVKDNSRFEWGGQRWK